MTFEDIETQRIELESNEVSWELPPIQFIKGCAQCFESCGIEASGRPFADFVTNTWAGFDDRYNESAKGRKAKRKEKDQARWAELEKKRQAYFAALDARILEAIAA